MKSIFKLSALALLATALTVSCEKEMAVEDVVNGVNNGRTHTLTLTFAQPATKVTIGEGENLGKTAWEAGDEIFIHTGHIRDGEYTTVTLTAEDISADGKKATITIPELKTYDWVGNGWTENAEDYSLYYASYPASAQANPSSCYSRSYFKNTNQPLMAGYSVGDNLIFHNVTGIITFKVTGDFDSYVFYGNKEETVGYETYAVELLPKGLDFMYKGTANPMTSIKGDVKASAVNYICLPNGTDFEAGFTIVLKKGDNFVKMAKTEKPVNVVRNGILDLGDITEKLVDYVAPEHHNSIENATDLSDVQANCFVMSAAGAYKFPAVKGEGTETVGEVAGVELLWETCLAKDAVTKNSVIAKVDYEDNWIYFQTSEDLLAGNALIAAKNANDEILWSWHIWIPKNAFTVDTFGLSSVPMMSRNLGALVDTPDPATGATVDATSAGLYYQWGRKDPFVGYKWGKSSYEVAVSGKSGRSMSKSTSQITLAESIAAPTTMVTFKGDWMPEHDNTLWGLDGDKTIYDPCPAGYRVPAFNTEDPMWQKVVDLEGFTADGTAGYWKVGTAVFNMTGFYDYDGGISHPYDRSFYWSNKNNSNEDYGETQYVYLDSDTWKSEPGWGKRKACALPVRCVKDEAAAPVEVDADAVTEVTFWQDTFATIRGTDSEKIVADEGETSATFTQNKLTFITGGGQFKFKKENPGERVQLGGTGTAGAKNCLQFKVAGNGILKVWARSSGNDARAIKVAVGDQELAEAAVAESKGAVLVNTFKVTAKTNDLINVFSKSSAINVYDMAWIPEGNEDPQPDVNPFTSTVAWAYNNTNKSYDEYAIHATYDGKTYRYVHNLKLGTGSAAGSATFTLPAGATKVVFYAVGWKGTPGNIKFTVNEKEYAFESIASDDVITGNGPYDLTVTDAMKYSFFLDAALAAQTTMTVTSLSPGYRVYIFGVTTTEEEIPVPKPAYEHQWGWYSAGDGSTLWTANVTAISVTHPDGYGMVRGLAMDDEYIYLPKSSAYAAIAAVKITDPNTQVKGDVSTVDAGDTFKSSFVRMMKNTDASVNGGKDVLLMSNLSAANGGNIVIYAYTNGIESAPIKLAQFAWDSANNVEDWRRYGDRFFVTGTWQDGKVWLPSFNPMKIVCLSVANGARTAVTQLAATEEVSPSGIKDITVWEGTDTQYLLTNASIANVVVPTGNKESHGWDELTLNFSVDGAKGTWGYNFFKFNDTDYIAYARIVDKKACVEIIEAGVNLGRAISAPKVLMQIPINSAASLDSELTTGGLADCAVRVIDGVPYIAALTRDGAMTVYKLVMK